MTLIQLEKSKKERRFLKCPRPKIARIDKIYCSSSPDTVVALSMCYCNKKGRHNAYRRVASRIVEELAKTVSSLGGVTVFIRSEMISLTL